MADGNGKLNRKSRECKPRIPGLHKPDVNVTTKVNNKGCYSHKPFAFMKSNETKTAFSVHHFSRLSVAMLADLRVVLVMYSKGIFCSKVADHSWDMPN